jgi:hypothetical protein
MLAFAFLNGGALLAALAVATRLGFRGPGCALSTIGGYLVLVHSSVLFAGLLGHLTVPGVAALGAAVALAAGCAAVAATGPAHAAGQGARRRPDGGPFTAITLFAPLAALATGAAWAWPHLFEGTRLWAWDDFTYHMVYPALWLREHAVAAVGPAQAFTMQAWYPLSASVIATWFMVPLAGAREEALAWVSLTGLLYAGLVAAGAGALCARLGCRRGTWAVPVVLFATSHRTVIMAGSFSDADLCQAVCLFGSLAFAVPRGEIETDRDVRVDGCYAGLLSGIALGVKVSAAAPALVVLLAPALRARASRTRPGARVRAVAMVSLIFAVSWAATGGYWYARNVLHTGNPVYPAAFLAWPGTTFPETTLLEYARRYGIGRAAADAFAVYLNWPRLHAGLAVAGLLGLAAWLVATRRSLTRGQRYLAATSLAVVAAVLVPLPAAPFSAGNALTFRAGFVHWDSLRYVAVALVLGWVGLAVVIDGGAGARPARGLAAALIAAAGAMSSGVSGFVLVGIAAAAALGARLSFPMPGLVRARPLGVGAAVVATLTIIVAWSHGAKREAGRAAFYGEPLFGAAAAVLDGQTAGARVAVFGDQWVYLAFGDRLHLRPVRLDRDGDVATRPIGDAMEPGDCTVTPAVFRSRLEASGVSLVVLVRQPHPGRPSSLPTQHAALEASGGAQLLYRDRAVAIWRLVSRSAGRVRRSRGTEPLGRPPRCSAPPGAVLAPGIGLTGRRRGSPS